MIQAMRPRPTAVSIVAIFLFAATVIAVVVGFSLLFPNRLLDRLWLLNSAGAAFFHSIWRISGVFLLVIGAATLVSACGLLFGRVWAWWIAIVLFFCDACGGIVSYFFIHDPLRTIIGVAISSTFFFVLCRRRVRDYFSDAQSA